MYLAYHTYVLHLKEHSGYSRIPPGVLSFKAELVGKHKPMQCKTGFFLLIPRSLLNREANMTCTLSTL